MPAKPNRHSLSLRFGDEVLQAGHTSIPNLMLNHYAGLGISFAEMMFVIHLCQYWWTEKIPYPSLRTIAGKMDVSWRQAANYAASLRKKGYLEVHERFLETGGQTSSEYDLSRLIQAVVERERALKLAERGEHGYEDACTGVDRDDFAPMKSRSEGGQKPASGRGRNGRSGRGLKPASYKEDSAEEHECEEEPGATRADVREEPPSDASMAQCPEAGGPTRPRQPEPLAVPGLAITAKQLWAAVLEELRPGCTPTAYNTWLRSTRVVGVEGDELVVGAPNSFACQWLTERLAPEVLHALRSVTGRSWAVRFQAEA